MKMSSVRIDQPSLERSRMPGRELRIWCLGFGIGFTILACLAFGHLTVASLISTFIIGLIMLIGAALHFGHAVVARHSHGGVLWALSGLFYLLAGLSILFAPVLGLHALTLALAVSLVVSGVGRLVIGVQHSANWVLLCGTASILVGAAIAMDWPRNSLWLIGALVGIDLLVQGIALVLTAVSKRFFAIVFDQEIA
jgi:uncharacterized membrane protein HdeD (DUF308 family)